MKKFLTLGLVCAALVCFCALPALNAADAPADGLKLANTKKAVTFNHSTHKGDDCKVCHHTWDGAAAIKKCSDAGCHDKMDKKDKSVNSYYKAMHAKKGAKDSCVSCHIKTAGKDKDKKKQLAGCNKSACHP